jgi:integrase
MEGAMASIYRTADNKWRCQVRKGGARLTRNFTRRVDAAAWASMQEAEIERDGAGLPRRISGTVGDLIDAYCKAIRPLKRYSLSKQYELDKLHADLGELSLSQINAEQLVRYAVSLRERMGGQGVLTRLCYLREVFRAAADLWSTRVPMPAIDNAVAALRRQRIVAKAPPRTRRPSDTELDAIIEFHRSQKRATVDLPAIIDVLRVLPLRIGELLKITWEDLDPERRTVTLRARKHPDSHVREVNDYTIPLPTIMGVDTWELIAGRPRYLPKPFPFVRTAVSHAFWAASYGAGVKNLHVHDLRAHSISRLLEANVAVPMIAHLSGHKSWRILQNTYSRLDPLEVAKAIERIAA